MTGRPVRGALTVALLIVVLGVLVAEGAYVAVERQRSVEQTTVPPSTSLSLGKATTSSVASRTAAQGSSSTTASLTTYAVTTATDRSEDMVLEVSLNASSMDGGQRIGIAVEDYNALPFQNNFTASDSWQIGLGTTDGQPCWTDTWPVGLAVAAGHYTASNVSSARLLSLVDPEGQHDCPPYLGTFGAAAGYSFEPSSDAAFAYGCSTSNCPVEIVTSGVAVAGYWSSGGTFTTFPRGTYTVLGEDEWGRSALAYFTVS
ncbi:MAG: hypothetical protein ABSF83_14285 [Nitrososphaerales archaeon]|jgi:hypothetical protein